MKSVTHVGAEFVTEDDGNQFFNTLTSLICHGIYTPPSSLKLSHIFLTSLGCHNWRISFLLHYFPVGFHWLIRLSCLTGKLDLNHSPDRIIAHKLVVLRVKGKSARNTRRRSSDGRISFYKFTIWQWITRKCDFNAFLPSIEFNFFKKCYIE